MGARLDFLTRFGEVSPVSPVFMGAWVMSERRSVVAVAVAAMLLGAGAALSQEADSGRHDLSDPSGFGDRSESAWREAGDAAAEYSEALGGRALLVVRDGDIVFERYADGWTPTRRHMLASGTKSFVGVLAAAAVQDGLLAWDESAADTLTEWREHPGKSRITVRQLLELSSGLEPGDGIVGWGGRRATREGAPARIAADRHAASLALELKHPPGTRFDYGPSHFFAFAELLERKLAAARDAGRLDDASLEAYLDRRVLAPCALGGLSRAWARDRAGHLNLPGGGRATAREWATFGEFIRRGGRVAVGDGAAIVGSDEPSGTAAGETSNAEPAEVAGASTNALRSVIDGAILAELFTPSEANPAYGLTWWLPRDRGDATAADGPRGGLRGRLLRRQAKWALDGREADVASGTASGSQEVLPTADAAEDPDRSPPRVWMAAGLHKQRLYVLPDHDLVVVRFGGEVRGLQRFDDRRILEPLVEARIGEASFGTRQDTPAADRTGGGGEAAPDSSHDPRPVRGSGDSEG